MTKRSAFAAPRGSPSVAVIAIAAGHIESQGIAAISYYGHVDNAASDSGHGRLGPS